MIISYNDCDIYIGKRRILKNVNFNLMHSNIIHLSGINGSGKTVFLESILGFYKIKNGIRKTSYKKNEISYIPDSPFFNDYETVIEVLTSISCFYNTKIITLIMILKVLDFDSSIKHSQRISTLSKGSQKKLLILPLFLESPIYIFDEIFDGLDAITRDKVIQRLIILSKAKCTLLFTEHDQHIVNTLHHVIPNIREVLCQNQNIIQK